MPSFKSRAIAALRGGLGLHPFEWVAFGMAAAALLFLRHHHLHYGWDTIAYTFPPLIGALPRLLVLGVALRLVHALVVRRSPMAYLRAIWRWSWIATWLRAWVGVMLFIYTYCWLKISVPLVRTELYDPQLWQLDRFLHFGLSPSVFAIELVAGTPLVGFLDRWYALWVPSLAIITAFFFATERSDRLRNLTLAVVLLWTVGAWGYLLVPALGPCYASHDVLDPIRRQIPHAISTQAMLWSHYLQMFKARTGLLSSFQPEFGVAAMPSLHVAAHALFFFWCRRHDRWLRLPFAIATGLTLFGSVVTGWHYAVDGYVGILLAWGAVALADRIEPVAGDPPRAAVAATPGDAAPPASAPSELDAPSAS